MRGGASAQQDRAPLPLQEALIRHLFQLPHHGAPVQAQVFRQRAVGQRHRKAPRALLRAQQAEVGQQLQPHGGLGQDVDPVGLLLRLARRHLEQVAHQLAVVGAGLGAALDDVLVINKQHPARLARGYIVLLQAARQQEQRAEHAVREQLLHHALVAVRVTVVQAGVPLHYHPQPLRQLGVGGDRLARAEALLPRVKACVHGRLALGRNVGEDRQLVHKKRRPFPIG